jgi:hypothetical protein
MFETHRHGSPQVILANAGATWEWLSGWLPGGMDAQAWEAVIPNMGHMALLRNLRNFDDAGISDTWRKYVEQEICGEEQVRRGMQFPFRYFSAYKHASDRWYPFLSKALDLSTSNIPALPGRTLVLCDTSGSMSVPLSRRSTMTAVEAAAVFAAAVARKNPGAVDLVEFASQARKRPIPVGASVLTIVSDMQRSLGDIGHSTDIARGLEHYSGHDRVIVFTDGQVNGARFAFPKVPVYLWNLMGYGASLSDGAQMEVGGMSDAAFRMIQMAESGRNEGWPF